jgi:hypothetical protein
MNKLLRVHFKSSQVDTCIVKVKEHALHISFSGKIMTRVRKDSSQETVIIRNDYSSRRDSLSSKERRVVKALFPDAGNRSEGIAFGIAFTKH